MIEFLDKKGSLLSTGDMARLCDTTLRTVRFYVEEGILHTVEREKGCNRYFESSELEKLRLAIDLREAGLSLQDIKCLFDLKKECLSANEATSKMEDILGKQIQKLEEKILNLERLQQEFKKVIKELSECSSCEDPSFPRGCQNCEVTQKPELSRALRVFWSTADEKR